MRSSIAYEQVRDDSNGEVGDSLVSRPPTRDLHASHNRRSLSHQDEPASSTFTGSRSDAEEAQAGLEMSFIRSMSFDSLQLTLSGATGSAGSVHSSEQPGDVGQPNTTQCSKDPAVASHDQEPTELNGPLLLPRRTIQRDLPWCLAWFFDIVLTMIPLLFLAIACLALQLDHKPISDIGEKALAASRIGPTLFPIAFAAISSRFFENLSRWQLERPDGIKLGILEQLAGSQSFPGAVQRAFTVRSGYCMSVVIVMVWALSPIGGQSSLRLFSHGHDALQTELDVFVANPENQESTFDSRSSVSDDSNAMATLYSGLLLSAPSQRADPVDLWGRPKIPQLPQAMVRNYTRGWHDMSEADLQHGEDYACLLGLDVRGFTPDIPERQIRFSVNTSYVDLECERVTGHRYGTLYQGPSGKSSFNASLQNYTERGEPMYWYFNTEPSGHRLYYDSRDVTQKPRGKLPANLTHFECLLRRIPVEVEFHCGPFPAAGCSARRLRQREERSDVYPWPSEEQEPIDPQLFQILPWSMSPPAVANMLAFWPTAAGTPDITEGASATDNFLAGDDALFVSHHIRDWNHDASDMNLFSRRMTTLFNTIFQVSLYPRNVTTADPILTGIGSVWEPKYDAIRATASDVRDIYVADRRWCATLLTIGFVLQALGIGGLWLRALIAGPSLLGYASSLMRDSPHFPKAVSACGSALSGADRARMCRDMRVQITDVRPSEKSGYIVFKCVSRHGDGDDLAGGRRKLDGKRLFD